MAMPMPAVTEQPWTPVEVEARAIEVRRAVDPGAAEIERESDRWIAKRIRICIRVGVRDDRRDRHWRGRGLAWRAGDRRGVTVNLFFQLGDRLLLGLELAFELCNLLALDFDQGSHTARLRLSTVP